jgi:hypothetical protein
MKCCSYVRDTWCGKTYCIVYLWRSAVAQEFPSEWVLLPSCDETVIQPTILHEMESITQNATEDEEKCQNGDDANILYLQHKLNRPPYQFC